MAEAGRVQHGNGWLERRLGVSVKPGPEALGFAVILALAVGTRFVNLECRVMSHDESLHSYYSWLLSQGKGYQHTPMMHGPLQFHLVALSYFLFGDSDASARYPAAAAGVLGVGLVWVFRRWLGRSGAMVAAALMVISPYMLYYSRYTRNESFVVVEALLVFWAVFRYAETRQARWIYLLAAALSLHNATKETYFIYTAQLLLFLGCYLTWQMLGVVWRRPGMRLAFAGGIVTAVLGGSAALYIYLRERVPGVASAAETGRPLDPSIGVQGAMPLPPAMAVGILLAVFGLALVALALYLGLGGRLKTGFPIFDLLVVGGSLTLPLVAALPASMLGWDPLQYENTTAVTQTAVVAAVLVLVAAGIGLWWDMRRWSIAAIIFYTLFTVLYTSLFTNSFGFFSGLVGSLGYWLVQHGVERGSQPLYYYTLVQIPVYEYLPAIGAVLAGGLGLRRWRMRRLQGAAAQPNDASEAAGHEPPFPVVLFLGYWSVTSLLVYSYAGEKMPWLTVHITLPMILLSGWSIGKLLDAFDWTWVREVSSWLGCALLLVGLLALGRAVGYLLGDPQPFQGSDLAHLETSSGFLISITLGIVALALMVSVARSWPRGRLGYVAGAVTLAILAALTARSAFRAAYLNGDNATEFLVYAHSAPGVKRVLAQLEDLSQRMTDGLTIDVAFDDDVAWPFTWYLRHYPNAYYYADDPSSGLLDYPVVIAGDDYWGQVDRLLAKRYDGFEYIRMWWPMQDYFNLTWDRIRNALGSAEYRVGLWNIWLNRDYTAYGQVNGVDYSLNRWSPSDRMKLYVRKDVSARVWDYGVVPRGIGSLPERDLYGEGIVERRAEIVIGGKGVDPGQFRSPRGLAVANDGTLYVADTGNHRIQHVSASGEALQMWGWFGSVDLGSASPGTFNEPWGVAVAPDGTVYVADTWNHRVQHFAADGRFLGTFGSFGQGAGLTGFWGPRGVAVDARGRVFVADTGNKRVVVLDSQGKAVGEFGKGESNGGQLDEPVGVAFGSLGRVYVTDTWNQRVQVFVEIGENAFRPVEEWQVEGWYGQSPGNKPYISISKAGLACVTDPEGYCVLCFREGGDFAGRWGDYGTAVSQFGLPAGLAFDRDDRLWVVDSGNSRLMRFDPALP